MTLNVTNKVVQNLPKPVLLQQVQNMLQHFEKYNFLQIHQNNLEFDIFGENLKEIIRKEWLLKNTTLSESPAFCVKELSENYFKTAYQKVKNLVTDLPYSFIEIYNKPLGNKPSLQNNDIDLIKNQFQVHSGTILKNQTLCTPKMGLEFFYKQQRERKIWWKQFAAMPERFNTTEISFEKDKLIFEIKAEFPWGFETIEIIKYMPEALSHDPSLFEVKNNEKFVPHIITCETSLETMTFTYLCDSFELLKNTNKNQVLRICRKFAPFKIAFAAKTNSVNVEHLKDLASLLAKQIRKNGISVLLLPDMCSITLEQQLCRNDAIGVPFTVIFDEKTLKDGIISIRSRDTTLKEQSHISLIVSYLNKLMTTG